MCGITGYLARGGENPGFRLAEAVRHLHHRGPDAQGVWEERGVGLGHARLSIIDLSPGGAQPMSNPDGRYQIVFNGEIYNFPDLRAELERGGETFASHSDTEVLLRLFVRNGLDGCLAKLRGMFAFAVWDRAERTLSLARDRLGVKPLVYAETPRGLAFASEIGALFPLDPALPRTPDLIGIDHYLTFQYIPAPLSGFAAIRKLPPAHAMTVRDGRIEKIWRYWNPDFSRRSALSFDDACAALREKMLEATRIRLLSDVPLGAFLSGGIDSSITVAAMTRLGATPVKTYAIGFEDERFNELPYARQIAAHLGSDHHEEMVRADAAAIVPKLVEHFGEPMADSSAIPTFHVSRFARQDVTVALTGDGGDETFAGYRRHYHASLTDRMDSFGLLPAWRGLRRLTVALENIGRKHKRAFPVSRADEILTLPAAERYKHLLAYFTDPEKAALTTPQFQAGTVGAHPAAYLADQMADIDDPINRYLALDTRTYLPEDILFKVDICSMMNSLECRSPFLDHELIEFAATLPGHFKLKPPHRHKHLLKEAFRDWLPAGFMERNKMGFSVPMARWLRESLAPQVARLAEENVLAAWIRQDTLRQLAAEHLAGKRDHAKRLWALVMLAEWVKIYAVPR